MFGSVVSRRRAQSEEQAATLASKSRFGLGAAISTANIRNARNLAEQQIDAESIAIKTFLRRDPRIPFGSGKESGFGRELGALGILESQKHCVSNPSLVNPPNAGTFSCRAATPFLPAQRQRRTLDWDQ